MMADTFSKEWFHVCSNLDMNRHQIDRDLKASGEKARDALCCFFREVIATTPLHLLCTFMLPRTRIAGKDIACHCLRFSKMLQDHL